MKAIQLTGIGQPLQLREVPIPQPGPDDVLVKIKAAGICRSDAHYRAGISPITSLPLTLGHEISGVAQAVGGSVKHTSKGDRICVHYMATCGTCHFCSTQHEQFCTTGQMIGKHCNGGYAEFALVPARSVFVLPEEIPFEDAAIMMCSSATSLHALHKASLQPGEVVAIFGFGGLGFSAVQLAKALGAADVYAIEINADKLKMAEEFGAVPIDARRGNPAAQILDCTKGRGADVALEFTGIPETMDAAVRCLAIFGRAAFVGLTDKSFPVAPYRNVINKEAELIGVSDHLASELPALLELARTGKLRFPKQALRTIPLEATAINETLDNLDHGTAQIRTVIQI